MSKNGSGTPGTSSQCFLGAGRPAPTRGFLRSLAALRLLASADRLVAVADTAIQVHGGIGFTWEHDVHFLLKRARVSSQLLGTAGQHRARVASLAGL